MGAALDLGTVAGNIITALALASAGVLALAMASAAARGDDTPLSRALALLAGIGLIALAADEGFDLHERTSRWLWDERGIGSPGAFHRLDDAIIVAYALAGIAAAAVAMPRLLRHRQFLFAMLAAAVLFAFAVGLDALGTPGTWTDALEEALEVIGAIVLAAAFARETTVRGHVPGATRQADELAPSISL